MRVQKYVEIMKEIQGKLLDYLDDGSEDDYKQLIKLISGIILENNRHELKSILQLISSIANNHHRSPDFFTKIEKILLQYKSQIKQTFTNSEIKNFFTNNKPILLFLYNEELITLDDLLQLNDSFLSFFYPEIENKIETEKKNSILENFKELQQNYSKEEFEHKRKIGENDSYICRLIRDDLIEDFVTYVNQTNLSLIDTKIEPSIFETNLFLINQLDTSLIEYATFCGSFQIFQYLRNEKVSLEPSLWIYAIHGNNAEMIHILEENEIHPKDFKYEKYQYRNQQFYHYMHHKECSFEKDSYRLCLAESIKCHHNNIFNYIEENYYKLNNNEYKDFRDYSDGVNAYLDDFDDYIDDYNNDHKIVRRNIVPKFYKYFNYLCFPIKIGKKSQIAYFCKYDYPYLLELALEEYKIKANVKVILKSICF